MKTNNIIRIFRWALVIVLTLSTKLQAQTVIIADFRVDNAPAGKFGRIPAIQSLSSGNSVIAWYDGRNGYEIYASIYDKSGAVIRDDYRIDDGNAGSVSTYTGAGGTTRDSNGNFFVTWLNGDGFTFNGRIRKFYPNGDPVGSSVDLSEFGGSGTTQVFHVARGANDKIIVSYIGPGGVGGSIYYRIFDNDLVPITTSIQVNQTQPGSIPAIGSDLAGNFVLAWKQYDVGAGLDGMMRARLYDSNGNPRTNEFTIESFMSGGSNPQVIYNKYGHFCVVWWAALTYGMGRIFDENGNPLTSVFYLGPFVADPPEQYGVPAVDSDDNGNFIITYEYSGGTTPKRIYGTIYDSNGFVVEVFFPVSAVTVGLPTNVMETDVAYIGEGRFVTTWSDGRVDSNGDIYAAILGNDHWIQPLGPIPVTGTVGLMLLIGSLGWMLKRRLKK